MHTTTEIFPELKINFLAIKNCIECLNISDLKEILPSISSVLCQGMIDQLLKTADVRAVKMLKYLNQPKPSLFISMYKDDVKHMLSEINNTYSQIVNELKNQEDTILSKIIIEKLEYYFKTIDRYLKEPRLLSAQKKQEAIKAKQSEQEACLRDHQNMLCSDPKIKKSFEELLASIKAYAIKNWNRPNGCFICYAWSAEGRESEAWVQKPFLVQLQSHLYQAGITTAKLDIISNPSANNIYEYMKAAETDDYILVIGTESLLDKHKQGTSAVCNELILINRKRRSDAQQGLYRTLPILLSGTYAASFPAYYELYTTIKDWREKSYLTDLKELIRWMYGIGSKVEEYNQLWEDFIKLLPVDNIEYLQSIPNVGSDSSASLASTVSKK